MLTVAVAIQASALRAQEQHTRTHVLNDLGSIMSRDLANANHLFHVQFTNSVEAAAAEEAAKLDSPTAMYR